MKIVNVGEFIVMSLLFIEMVQSDDLPRQLSVQGHAGSHRSSMGIYTLDGSQAFGIPRYVQSKGETGNDPFPNHILYRGGDNGRWIIAIDENDVAQKQGVLITESEESSSPVGLIWLAAEDGAWVRDGSMRVLIQSESHSSQHVNSDNGRGVDSSISRHEFEAMAKRALEAESKIEALESDLSTTNLIAADYEKKYEDCNQGRDQTLEILGKITDENTANIAKLSSMEEKLQLLTSEIETYKDKLINAQKGRSEHTDMIEIGGLASMGCLFLIILAYLAKSCCGGSSKRKSNLGSDKKHDDLPLDHSQDHRTNPGRGGRRTLDDDTLEDEPESTRDNDDSDKEGASSHLTRSSSSSNDLPARHRSSQAVSSAPRPGGVLGSTSGSTSKRHISSQKS